VPSFLGSPPALLCCGGLTIVGGVRERLVVTRRRARRDSVPPAVLGGGAFGRPLNFTVLDASPDAPQIRPRLHARRLGYPCATDLIICPARRHRCRACLCRAFDALSAYGGMLSLAVSFCSCPPGRCCCSQAPSLRLRPEHGNGLRNGFQTLHVPAVALALLLRAFGIRGHDGV
jgi:hypothetical protein